MFLTATGKQAYISLQYYMFIKQKIYTSGKAALYFACVIQKTK